ncbi:acyl carrier protein [Actinoplanes derwentensis]|uniref:Acyl carrier protein n=1 Tax=Actinoplanes derwentensis TaxID=113562 RepID=A0A1H2DCP6_9ACTN|nr:acyl carrier protein [Actinoplanes derwentensis]GID89563.1 hypothetical protein Ade03nite_84870 [Actinoplanes derwentensis]SDT80528.1 Acyl carrier protein [Actinoplanes derwentensis]
MRPLEELIAAVLTVSREEIDGGLSRTTHGDTWTSMRHVELMVAVEEQYGTSLTAREMAAVDSVDDLRDLLAVKLARR